MINEPVVFSHHKPSEHPFSPLSIHIHPCSLVRQQWEPGQLHNSQLFILMGFLRSHVDMDHTNYSAFSALSSKKVSVNEISVLTINIFQKGDGIIFNMQETISQIQKAQEI